MAKRQNGVDGAIALLLALVRHNGRAPVGVLVQEIGVPRASLYRIARILQDNGLVRRERGMLLAGPKAAGFIRAGDAGRHKAGPERGHRSENMGLAGQGETGPIALSAPPAVRRGERYRIGFSNASMANPWRVALVHSVEFAAARLGRSVHRLTVLHADDDAHRQVADIDALVAQGVDGLIVSAVAPGIVAPAVSRAMAKGIAVVLVDRGVAADVAHTSFVSTDDGVIGRMTALWLAETLRGQGAILMLPGHEEAEPARRRLMAAQEVLTAYPGISSLGVEWTGWHRERARRIVLERLARAGPPIAGVWCDSGLQGVGSLQAFIDSGIRPIPPHTGGDLNLAYKLAIRHGVALAAVDYPPAMGLRAVEVLHAALRGQWVASRVDVASEVILTKGAATRSVRPDRWAQEHVRWDLPDDLILHSGLGEAYNPRSFRIHYPGNSYNRSAARVSP